MGAWRGKRYGSEVLGDAKVDTAAPARHADGFSGKQLV